MALVVAQSPNFLGCIEDMDELSDITHAIEALFSANITEPLSLGSQNTWRI